MERILGIDYGIKRIGVATGDLETKIAMPLTMLPGRNNVKLDAQNVASLAKAEEASAIVVGLPINMEGSDSQQTTLTRKFAAELTKLFDKPVHLHDERLSSYAADEVLIEAGISPRRRKGLSDQIAAQKILQSYLDQQ